MALPADGDINDDSCFALVAEGPEAVSCGSDKNRMNGAVERTRQQLERGLNPHGVLRRTGDYADLSHGGRRVVGCAGEISAAV